jgi:hypothetical protein
MSRWLWGILDVKIIDRTTYLLSDLVKGTGATIKVMVNGNVQQYALYMLLGLVSILMFILMRT